MMKARKITVEITFLEPTNSNETIEDITVKVDDKVIQPDDTGLRDSGNLYDLFSNYCCGISLSYGEW